MLSSFADRFWEYTFNINDRRIHDVVLARGNHGTLVDLGCGEAELAAAIARHGGFSRTIGVEIDEAVGKLATKRGVEVVRGDLNACLPLPEAIADVIIANQVIEHIANTDMFFDEINRLLKPGGIAVVSTESISSWHNLLAASVGWQPFSLTNISAVSSGVGNPFALHRGEGGWPIFLQHLRIFAPRGLKEFAELHELKPLGLFGSGYFPFYGKIADLLARTDPLHSVLITLLVTKRAC